MKTRLLSLFALSVLIAAPAYSSDADKDRRQVGVGFGTVSPYPMSSFPYALMAVVEGTYRFKYFGVSILGTATSSQKVGDTYWFGSDRGGYQQTFLEPRAYLGPLHVGFAVGLNLSSGTSGTIQSVASYGPMFGLEVPFRTFSVGLDARYMLAGQSAASSPLSTVMMFRFRF